MKIVQIYPDVSDIEIMRRIRRAKSRCYRLIPGRRVKTVMTDKVFDVTGIEKRDEDWRDEKFAAAAAAKRRRDRYSENNRYDGWD